MSSATDTIFGSMRSIPCFLQSGNGTAPAFAALDFVSTTVREGILTVDVKQPATSDSRCMFFNGPTVLKEDRLGRCYNDFPLQALYAGGSSPVALDTMGTVAGEWDLAVIATPDMAPCGYYYVVIGDGHVPGTVFIKRWDCPYAAPQNSVELVSDVYSSGSVLLTVCKRWLYFPDCDHNYSVESCVDL